MQPVVQLPWHLLPVGVEDERGVYLLRCACREQRRRDAELREFDDLLKRREEFKRGGGPGRGL